jgi:hypothetical protein
VPAVPTIIKRSAQASGDLSGGQHDNTVSGAKKTKTTKGIRMKRKEGDEVRR